MSWIYNRWPAFRNWFGYVILRRPPQVFEDCPPTGQPHTRVWSVFGTANRQRAVALVEATVRRCDWHPDFPDLQAGQSFAVCWPSKRFWRIHTPYARERSDDR